VRILLTGITGQIGGALSASLQGIGTIVAADRRMLDLARPESIAGTLDDIGPDIIINPAAYTAVDKAEDEREIAMVVNGEAPGVIGRWAAKGGIPFIHFSTDYVFSGSGMEPWREDDRAQPLSAYGTSKLAGENEIRAAGGCFLIVRTSWVYSARGTNFLRTIARLARQRSELRIVDDQIGAPTSAALIADALVRMVEGGIGGLRQRIDAAKGCVHLAAAGETSWYGFAGAIIDGLRMRGARLSVKRLIPIRATDYPRKAQPPHNSRLSLSRLRQVFGISPLDWKSALPRELDIVAEEMAAS
jgi:dTDP-4-dehydrorhamnose reductase